MTDLVNNLLAATVFALLGILIFVAAFLLFDRLTPGTLWKELIDDQNVAVGVLMAGISIAIAIIIAAAVH